jgi:hypothetical protein
MYVCSYAIAINHIAVGAKHKKKQASGRRRRQTGCYVNPSIKLAFNSVANMADCNTVIVVL